MAMMRDAADVLTTRGTPLSPDLKVQIEKEMEGFVVFRAFFLLPTNHSDMKLGTGNQAPCGGEAGPNQ